MLGRDFHPAEDQPAAPRTALLSYAAWQRRFGGRNGRHRADRQSRWKPERRSSECCRAIFTLPPLNPPISGPQRRSTGGCERRGCHNLFGIARLKAGVTFDAAFADITTIAQNLERQYPDSNRDQKAFMMTLTDVIVGDIRPILLVLLAGPACCC